MHLKALLLLNTLYCATTANVPRPPPQDQHGVSSRSGNSPASTPNDIIDSRDVPDDYSQEKRDESGPFRNVLYVTNWSIYGAGYKPDRIPSNFITHLMYSFADILANGTVVSSDSWADVGILFDGDSAVNKTGTVAFGLVNQFWKLKQANRNLKVLLAIGGYTWSPKFAPVAASPIRRANFVKSAVQLMIDWGMDGLDIDWEYPNTKETNRDIISLLAELRKAMDDHAQRNAVGYHFLLTMPGPAGPQNYNNFDFKAMDKHLDFWSIMTFDYAGPWDTTTGHQSNIYPSPDNPTSTKFSTDRAVTDYIQAGIDPRRLNMAMPLYGRAFDNTDGLGKPYSGIPNGTLEPGIWLYKDLPRPGADDMWDRPTRATYSYDRQARQFVTYDDLYSSIYKTQYMRSKGLGGMMYWEASGDKTGTQSIVCRVAGNMRALQQSQNNLLYPQSKYDNIRALSVPMRKRNPATLARHVARHKKQS